VSVNASTGPLTGRTYRVVGGGPAAGAAERLLAVLGARASGAVEADLVVDVGPEIDPLAEWARCGGMWLTGEPTGPPLPAPGDQAARLVGVAAVAGALAAELGTPIDLDGPGLIGERAAALGLRRRGTTSPNGGARLLPAADGWVAMTLARPEDVELLAAWMEHDWHGDEWDAVEAAMAKMPAAAAVDRARLLGLPAAVCAPPDPAAGPPLVFTARVPAPHPRPGQPLVVDLSSLWAGPLCTRILASAGARVIKVESVHRPDGARAGPALFFDLMHAGKESVALDFVSGQGRAALHALVAAADVVVESSRPRALEQLGIDASAHPGVWLSITGYGRAAPGRDWVAFGDDAAVAGGIAALTGEPGGPPMFCADAYADPVTGLFAVVAGMACLAGGGSWLVDVAMRGVVAHLLTDAPRMRPSVPIGYEAEPPPMPVPAGAGPTLGEHTEAVLSELGIAS
jgi:crotonobetainyl-CoA:carnitine CoA-transferase CaiB-like acyl-CoA transferase